MSIHYQEWDRDYEANKADLRGWYDGVVRVTGFHEDKQGALAVAMRRYGRDYHVWYGSPRAMQETQAGRLPGLIDMALIALWLGQASNGLPSVPGEALEAAPAQGPYR